MPKPVITNLGHGKYTYRGFAIHREDDQKGRWGYWRAKKDDELLLSATQGALLRQIDAHIIANSPCEPS